MPKVNRIVYYKHAMNNIVHQYYYRIKLFNIKGGF